MNYDILKNRIKYIMENFNYNKLLILIVFVVVILLVFLVIKQIKSLKDNSFIKLSTNSEGYVDNSLFYTTKNDNEIDNGVNNTSLIKVHIDGGVLNPGVVDLPQNSRIQDAVIEAGGLNEDASIKNINLAEVLEDGQKVYIPSIEEDEIISENNEINKEYVNNKSNGKININTSSIDDLQKIDGVGPSLANRIYQYRIKNGPYKSIDELKNVSGIGDKKLDSIRDLICI